MNKIILRDSRETHLNLLPLTYTRPVADLIVGINTIRQKWQMYLPGDYSYDVEEYLREKYPPAEIGPGDLIITMGAGDVTLLGPAIVEGLKAR